MMSLVTTRRQGRAWCLVRSRVIVTSRVQNFLGELVFQRLNAHWVFRKTPTKPFLLRKRRPFGTAKSQKGPKGKTTTSSKFFPVFCFMTKTKKALDEVIELDELNELNELCLQAL